MTTEERIQAINTEMEGMTEADLQTPDQVSNYLTRLSANMAYVNEQMAHFGRALNIAKRDAYSKLQDDFNQRGITLSPSLAKDYIKSLCSKEGYQYQLAERCSRTITHTMDAMRSVLSTKKAELEALRYAGA